MIDRTVETALLVLAVFLVFLSPNYSTGQIWGVGAGLLLSLLNLSWLHRLLGGLLGGDRKGLLRLLFLKAFFFYGLVVAVLVIVPLSVGSFAVGYTIPLCVLLLKLLGGQMTGRADLPVLSRKVG